MSPTQTETLFFRVWPNICKTYIIRSCHKKLSAFNTTKKIQRRKIKNKKYNKHAQREVELSSTHFSMIEKVPKQQYIDIQPILFQNDDPINAQLDNTGNILVTLQPYYPFHYVVYPISEANSSTPFNFLIHLKKSRWWGMNAMNNEKQVCDMVSMKDKFNL